MSGPAARLEPLLLWLWKVLPLPQRLRRFYLELAYPRFLLGVVALIQDERGRVLILDHTYRQKYDWGLPGGYLQTREEPTAGLVREVYEETGFDVEVGPIVAATTYKGYELNLLYRARIVGGTFRRSAEIRAWRYADPAELAGILPHQLAMLRQAGILGGTATG